MLTFTLYLLAAAMLVVMLYSTQRRAIAGRAHSPTYLDVRAPAEATMEHLNILYSVSPSDSGWQWRVNSTGFAPDRSVAIAEATYTIERVITQERIARDPVELVKGATPDLTESYRKLKRLRRLVQKAEHVDGRRTKATQALQDGQRHSSTEQTRIKKLPPT